jgi:hypothetical protein
MKSHKFSYDTRNIDPSIIQAHLRQIKKKYQSHSLNSANKKVKIHLVSQNWDLVLLHKVSSHLIVFIYWSHPCLRYYHKSDQSLIGVLTTKKNLNNDCKNIHRTRIFTILKNDVCLTTFSIGSNTPTRCLATKKKTEVICPSRAKLNILFLIICSA